jgi:hypothetical protein
LDHLHQVWVNGRFTAAELDDPGVSFSLNESVQHEFNLFHGQAKPNSGIGKTNGAVEVAARVDLNQSQADVLFVFRAEAAVQGATVYDLCAVLQGQGAGFIELHRVHVHLGVGTDNASEPPVGWTPFTHQHLVFFDQYLGIDHRFAFRTDAARQFVEYVISVLFDPDFTFVCWLNQMDPL